MYLSMFIGDAQTFPLTHVACPSVFTCILKDLQVPGPWLRLQLGGGAAGLSGREWFHQHDT